MTVLPTALDTNSPEYEANRAALLEKIAALEAEHAKALAGGGEKYVTRHRKRGKLPARERIELLVDPDTPFLELSPSAASSRPASGSSCSSTPTPRSWSCRRWPPGAATTRSAPRSSPGSGWWRASSA